MKFNQFDKILFIICLICTLIICQNHNQQNQEINSINMETNLMLHIPNFYFSKTLNASSKQEIFTSLTRKNTEEILENNITNVPQNSLKIKIQQNNIKANIQNSKDYQAVLKYLEKLKNIHAIYLDLCNTNTVIYLDELLKNQTIGYLDIKNGGNICIKDQTFLKTSSIYHINLRYVFEIQKNLFDAWNGLEICIQLNNQYTGIFPTIDFINNITCENIALKWDGKGQLNGMEKDWEYFYSVLAKEDQYLKGVYQTNQENLRYTSYEFCKEASEEISKIFIFIKDIEHNKDIQILEISKSQLANISRHTGKRFYFSDINFDGYQDLIFVGDNDNVKLYYQCICFLWNEKEQLYKLCETAPRNFKYIDEKEKRLLYNTSVSAFEDTYYIYKYNGILYEEQRLDVLLPQINSQAITWKYFKNGQLQKKIEVTPNKESHLYTVIFYEKENVQYKLLPEDMNIWDIGRKYFPEFDFYNFG